MERLVILNQKNNLNQDFKLSNLLDDIGELTSNPLDIHDDLELNIKEAREKFEKEYFLSQIRRYNGNIIKISKITGMERTALYRKLKLLNIDLNKI